MPQGGGPVALALPLWGPYTNVAATGAGPFTAICDARSYNCFNVGILGETVVTINTTGVPDGKLILVNCFNATLGAIVVGSPVVTFVGAAMQFVTPNTMGAPPQSWAFLLMTATATPPLEITRSLLATPASALPP